MGYLCGKMEIYLWELLLMAWSMVKADGNQAKITIRDHGSWTDLKGSVKFALVHHNIKEILKMGTNMGVEFKFFLMEIDTKDYTQTVSQKEMEFIAGKMGLYIKGNLKMASDMDMDVGHLEIKDMRAIT